MRGPRISRRRSEDVDVVEYAVPDQCQGKTSDLLGEDSVRLRSVGVPPAESTGLLRTGLPRPRRREASQLRRHGRPTPQTVPTVGKSLSTNGLR